MLRQDGWSIKTLREEVTFIMQRANARCGNDRSALSRMLSAVMMSGWKQSTRLARQPRAPRRTR